MPAGWLLKASFGRVGADVPAVPHHQADRANNIIKGSKKEQLETVRQQIRDFKSSTGVDRVVVLWTANTERYAEVSHTSI
jgi:myo-inositol-1-phosphate synthase